MRTRPLFVLVLISAACIPLGVSLCDDPPPVQASEIRAKVASALERRDSYYARLVNTIYADLVEHMYKHAASLDPAPNPGDDEEWGLKRMHPDAVLNPDDVDGMPIPEHIKVALAHDAVRQQLGAKLKENGFRLDYTGHRVTWKERKCVEYKTHGCLVYYGSTCGVIETYAPGTVCSQWNFE
jgi:hypothetical protein